MNIVRNVLGFLAIVVIIALLLNLDLVKYPFVLSTSPDCVPAQTSPNNSGLLIVLDTRDARTGTEFVQSKLVEWIDAQQDKLRPLRSGTKDIVVYVHGFRTSLETATCVADNLRVDLSDLPHFRGVRAPDVVIFGWPGELEPNQFPAAQKRAIRAASYLTALFSVLRDRRIILVAHSLGAQVVMEALDLIKKNLTAKPFEQSFWFRALSKSLAFAAGPTKSR